LLCDGFHRYSEERRRRASASSPAHDPRAAIRAEWQRLAQMGWLGLGLPEAIGGCGGVADLGLLLRAAGAGLWPVPLIQCLGEACGALLAAPSGPARDRLLQAVIAGEAIAGFAAVDADDGSPTVAERVDATFRIDGRKCFLLQGAAWTHVLVTAECVADGGIGLYLVEQSAPGLGLRRHAAVDGRCAADAHFDGVMAQRIAQGAEAIVAAHRRGQLLASAEEAGVASAAWEATTRHLADRTQFGQPILRFQAIRHRLVEAHVCVRELDSLLEHVATAFDAVTPELPRLLLQLRGQASLTATRVTQLGIQLHGGMGMTAAMPLGDYYKRAMLLGNLFGSTEVALDELTETLDLDCHQSLDAALKQGIEYADRH
jgi:alkylation response protein AidB-like acyl-CoA dehydrogenase